MIARNGNSEAKPELTWTLNICSIKRLRNWVPSYCGLISVKKLIKNIKNHKKL